MKAHQRTEGKSDDWLTPPAILKSLGKFGLDPASASNMPWEIAPVRFIESGLTIPWFDRVWLNPPFNRYERPKWMKKMAEHRNGIMLIPASTETKAFKEYVWEKADAVCFVYGRPHFHYVDGSRAKANCGCSLALVAYGEINSDILHQSNLGKTIKLS